MNIKHIYENNKLIVGIPLALLTGFAAWFFDTLEALGLEFMYYPKMIMIGISCLTVVILVIDCWVIRSIKWLIKQIVSWLGW